MTTFVGGLNPKSLVTAFHLDAGTTQLDRYSSSLKIDVFKNRLEKNHISLKKTIHFSRELSATSIFQNHDRHAPNVFETTSLLSTLFFLIIINTPKNKSGT